MNAGVPLSNHSRFTFRKVDAQISTTDRYRNVFSNCYTLPGEGFTRISLVRTFATFTMRNCFECYILLRFPRVLHPLLLWRDVPGDTSTCSAFLGLIPSSSQHSIRLATYEQRLACQCTCAITGHHFDYITNG
jgi:hypothetical protein